jgi:regulator of protease activity HflC (stomatin/prohibitin superfamily)
VTFVVPLADRMVKVSMQTMVLSVPAQSAITRDNVTLTVDAVVHFAVIDPIKAVVNMRHLPERGVPGSPDVAAFGDRPRRPGHPADGSRADQRRVSSKPPLG